ncbi:right-handed parallel beta-helix repeat-containing protein [Methanobrevibacter arboriphilus]|uniref:Uncharacterized protein n=1 Tax=Methanobrevibacter arboriphilus TaxID=39441 RepID=A0ACA8R2K4_METAZ|nr:right-handed parallel beta-helix repeat-containing protein [Methanobrevibacter arboriphilus]BBL61559.1 hypothetical protein MarbSA_05990 [Methanobrevibacter arboriphilus]
MTKKLKYLLNISIFLMVLISVATIAAEDVNGSKVIDIDDGMDNDQIQAKIDDPNTENGDTLNFKGSNYNNINLIINKSLNFVSTVNGGTTINTVQNQSYLSNAVKSQNGSYGVGSGINNINTTVAAFYLLSGSENSSITGFNFKSTLFNPGNSTSRSFSHILVIDTSNVNIIKNNFDGAGVPIAIANSQNILVEENNITNSSYYAINVREDESGRNNIINKNNIINGYDGISVQCSNTLASNNYVYNMANNGFGIWHSGSNSTLINNTADTFKYGVFIKHGGGGDYIINNTWINASSWAVELQGTNTQIINNSFYNMSTAIYQYAKGASYYLSGNTFTNVTTKFALRDSILNGSYINTSSSIPNATVYNGANISISSKVSQSSIVNGKTVTYTILLSNNGDLAGKNLRISDIIPVGSKIVSYQASRGTFTNGTWNIETLGADGDALLTVTVQPVQKGTYSTNTEVSYDAGIEPVMNTTEAKTLKLTVNPDVKLSYSASVSSNKVKVGKTAIISVKITNSGKDKSSPIKIYNKLPKSLKNVFVNYKSIFKSSKWQFSANGQKSIILKMKVKVTKKGILKVPIYANGKLIKTITIKGVK